jgi:hypothetical protein
LLALLSALHVLGYLLLYFASCVNPIIYVIMNKQYRQAYAGVISCSRIRASLTPHGSSAPGQNNFAHQGNDQLTGGPADPVDPRTPHESRGPASPKREPLLGLFTGRVDRGPYRGPYRGTNNGAQVCVSAGVGLRGGAARLLEAEAGRKLLRGRSRALL